MTKQTKAQRLFNNARREAKATVTGWPELHIDALSGLWERDDDAICQRTVNAIRKEAEKYLQEVAMRLRFGVYTSEEADVENRVVRIVLNTCDNWERDNEAFKASLKAL